MLILKLRLKTRETSPYMLFVFGRPLYHSLERKPEHVVEVGGDQMQRFGCTAVLNESWIPPPSSNHPPLSLLPPSILTPRNAAIAARFRHELCMLAQMLTFLFLQPPIEDGCILAHMISSAPGWPGCIRGLQHSTSSSRRNPGEWNFLATMWDVEFPHFRFQPPNRTGAN